ncbi:unnamed protein product [Ambrosiozyma monospora]|uniref:Unnamed protein product n=1 Tax=Ambrosiozyma monospora TaxID=43982 RepID=A0ACB5T9A2_AMBMO|nr:unnamed protein product [Ambrosiozyma monospora]
MQATQEAPTLHPTVEQFANPIQYLNSAEVVQLGAYYGIVKVKPPTGWQPPLSIDPSSFKFHTRLQNLSELNLTNRSRRFWLSGFNNYLRTKGKKPIKTGYVDLNDSGRIHLYDVVTVKNFQQVFKDRFKDKDVFRQLCRYSKYLTRQIAAEHENSGTGNGGKEKSPITEALEKFRQHGSGESLFGISHGTQCEVTGSVMNV